MVLWHLLVVTNIDNFLRPILVPRGARLNSALMLLSVFAGIATFGAWGIVIGPVLMILIVTTIDIYLAVYKGVELQQRVDEPIRRTWFRRKPATPSPLSPLSPLAPLSPLSPMSPLRPPSPLIQTQEGNPDLIGKLAISLPQPLWSCWGVPTTPIDVIIGLAIGSRTAPSSNRAFHRELLPAILLS